MLSVYCEGDVQIYAKLLERLRDLVAPVVYTLNTNTRYKLILKLIQVLLSSSSIRGVMIQGI